MSLTHDQKAERRAGAIRALGYDLDARIREAGEAGQGGPVRELRQSVEAYALIRPTYALRCCAWANAWLDRPTHAGAEAWYAWLEAQLEAQGCAVGEPWAHVKQTLWGASLREAQAQERRDRERAKRLPEGPPMEPDEYDEPAMSSPWA